MKKIFVALALVLTSFSAQAAEQCNASNVGVTSCMSEKLCECKFFRKSEMKGTPDRFSWDCGVMRPSCGGRDVDVTNTPPYNGPSSVGYGVSTTNINQDQSPTTTNSNINPNTLTQQQQSPTTTNSTTSTQTLTPSQTTTQSNTQNN